MPSARGSAHVNATARGLLWKLSLFSLVQLYWWGTPQPVAVKTHAAHQKFRGGFCVPAHRVSGSGLVQELQGNLSPLMWEQGGSSFYHLSPGNRGGFCCLQPMSYNWSSSSPFSVPSSVVYVLWFLSARKYAHRAYQIWNASTLPLIWKNKCIFRYFFNQHSELDVFGVFKCNFSGRCNNTFKLVVGDIQ